VKLKDDCIKCVNFFLAANCAFPCWSLSSFCTHWHSSSRLINLIKSLQSNPRWFRRTLDWQL
jgi:hypothetical protein